MVKNQNNHLITPYYFLKHFYSDEQIKNFIHIFNNKTIFLIYSPLFKQFINYFLSSSSSESNIKIKIVEKLNKIYSLNDNIFFAPYKLGSSATLEILEISSFYCFKNIIQIGYAGSFFEEINIGDIFISEGAFTDSIIPNVYTNKPLNFDGLNEFYFIDNFYETDKELTEKILNVLGNINITINKLNNTNLNNLKTFEFTNSTNQNNKENINIFKGKHFSTEFIFKETLEKFHLLEKCGAKTVEMEGATFFGFCKSKNIKTTSIYIISDKIEFNKKNWLQAWDSNKLKESFYFIIKKLLIYNLNLSI
ncbi:MAG: hypothetical protein N3A58_06740 [Spirochaetes bacterium]|nr:hypothetical protein [Spirochaetota bacterium]